MYDTNIQVDRVLIVAVETPDIDSELLNTILEEMESLVTTAGGQVCGCIRQKLRQVDKRSLVGEGKLLEIEDYIVANDVNLLVTYNPLTPNMHQYLTNRFDIRLIDRVQLILDIFAMRARSREGKLQVELAQYKYLLPRMVGRGKSMSRLGGGIGSRGPGETQLETDRRHIRRLMRSIEKDLKEVEDNRDRTRHRRLEGSEFNVGLVGYTNAGKSTLLSQLTGQETYVENLLFATLDPLTRKLSIRGQDAFTLTDTVGFIEALPQQLIQTFKSTLEEIRQVDMLLHVVDVSDPAHLMHEEAVMSLLKDLEMDEIPILTLYNKKDQLKNTHFSPTLFPHLIISAHDETDIERVKEGIWQEAVRQGQELEVRIPADQADDLYHLKKVDLVESIDFDEDRDYYVVHGYNLKKYDL